MIGEAMPVIPDLAEPVRAYRAWRLSGDGALLSINGARWVPGQPLHARCAGGVAWSALTLPEHDCPSDSAALHVAEGCGIYAFDSPSHAVAQYRATAQVFGTVLLWGRVFPHEHGWRAEWAQPETLWADPAANEATTAAVKRVAGMYRVPLRPWPDGVPERSQLDEVIADVLTGPLLKAATAGAAVLAAGAAGAATKAVIDRYRNRKATDDPSR